MARASWPAEEPCWTACPRAIILRTSWVYARDREELRAHHAERRTAHGRLRVVADQHGCPTSAADLAEAILAIAARLATREEETYAGRFPCRRNRLDHLARISRLRSSRRPPGTACLRPTWSRSRRPMADARAPAAEFPAGLRKTCSSTSGSPAALAGKPDPHD